MGPMRLAFHTSARSVVCMFSRRRKLSRQFQTHQTGEAPAAAGDTMPKQRTLDMFVKPLTAKKPSGPSQDASQPAPAGDATAGATATSPSTSAGGASAPTSDHPSAAQPQQPPSAGTRVVPLADLFKTDGATTAHKRAHPADDDDDDENTTQRPAPALRPGASAPTPSQQQVPPTTDTASQQQTASTSRQPPPALPAPVAAPALPTPAPVLGLPAPAPPAPGLPAPVPGVPLRTLTQQEMESEARERLEHCRQLCATATASKQPLPLQQLLLEPGWARALANEMAKPSFQALSTFVNAEYSRGKVYPPREMIFRAMNSCPLDQVKVVIVGQDPYPSPGHAMGLCFSVNRGVRVPQSLINIYKELEQDLSCPIPKHGDLSSWSTQGVLMLNTLLTVRDKAAASHKKQGWEPFTDAAITAISKHCSPGVVFLLWGKHAEDKAKLVNSQKHHVLTSPHPSPLAAASGKMFVGCRHFSKANQLLEKQGRPAINWCIPS